MKFLKFIAIALVSLLAMKAHSAQEIEFLENASEGESQNNLRENSGCLYLPCTTNANCCTGHYCGSGSFCVKSATK
jgi:hypothetical protein